MTFKSMLAKVRGVLRGSPPAVEEVAAPAQEEVIVYSPPPREDPWYPMLRWRMRWSQYLSDAAKFDQVGRKYHVVFVTGDGIRNNADGVTQLVADETAGTLRFVNPDGFTVLYPDVTYVAYRCTNEDERPVYKEEEERPAPRTPQEESMDVARRMVERGVR